MCTLVRMALAKAIRPFGMKLDISNVDGTGWVRCRYPSGGRNADGHEHPVVLPQVSHLRQVPLRTKVKLPHSPHISPS